MMVKSQSWLSSPQLENNNENERDEIKDQVSWSGSEYIKHSTKYMEQQ